MVIQVVNEIVITGLDPRISRLRDSRVFARP
jgi:hypothetical protein